MKRRISFFFILWCSVFILGALEIKDGRIKIDLSEGNGRFTIYFLQDVAKNTYVPLFLDQMPPTSSVTLIVDSKTYRLGDTADFRIKAKQTDTGGEIEFRSNFCVVRESFSFIKSEQSALSDGVKLTFTLENIGEKDLSAGLKILFDTYLGEKTGPHFQTDLRAKIQEELALGAQDKDKYWASLNEGGFGFQFMIEAEGATRPSSIIFANWKRLNEASWAIDVNSARNFNLLPYSVNDSAVSIFYEPTPVTRGGKREISAFMGKFSGSGFSLATGRTKTDELFTSTVLGKPVSAEDKRLSLQTDLIAVRDLLSQINRKLSAGESIGDDELNVMRQVIDQLKARKKTY